MSSPSPRLVWLDIETTGLDPKKDQILAMGAVVTDFSLTRRADPVEFYIHRKTSKMMEKMEPYVQEMHFQSGLMAKCSSNEALPEWEVYRRIRSYVFENCPDRKTTYLAGSSIHFDRSFIAEHTPLLLEHVSHRMVDVSTLKVLASAWVPTAKPNAGPPAHLPLKDLQASIDELKYWMNTMFRLPLVQSVLGP